MRAFIALELSSNARLQLSKIRDEWKPSIPSARWVRPENLHLTLRFLGDVEPDAAAALGESLRPAVSEVRPFAFSLRGAGCFPNVRRARVVWVGITPVPDELFELERVVSEIVGSHGFVRERRRFTPHLTIARLKAPHRSVGTLVDALAGRELGETDVAEVVLFESRLTPEGALHRAVERFPVDAPGG